MDDKQYRFLFRMEVSTGQPLRQVDADSCREEGDWLIFFREKVECLRLRSDVVLSMTTKAREEN